MALDLDTGELRGLLGQLDELERAGDRWCLLFLEELECNETEDWTGADEVRLHVRLDGAKASTFELSSLPDPVATTLQYVQLARGAALLDAYKLVDNRSMNDGDTVSLGHVGAFTEHAQVAVYDADAGWGDDDDRLGAEKITPPMGDAEKLKVRFTRDDADYELRGWIAKPSWLLDKALGQLEGRGGGATDGAGGVTDDPAGTATGTATGTADGVVDTAKDTAEDTAGGSDDADGSSDDTDVINDVLDSIG